MTIRDVARLAKVSPGTVSRAINNSPLVNAETHRRIMEVVQEVQYTPNLAGQRLSTGKTMAIGLIVPFFTRPSVTERLYGAVGMLAQSRYDLVIHDIETAEQRAVGFRDLLQRERVDGVVILSLPIHDDDVALIHQADVPVVLVDTEHAALSSLPSVTVDDVAGGRTATQYLIELGHTRIGFIGDRVDVRLGFVSSRNRYQGYCTVLNEAGITIHPEYYSEDEHGRASARSQARSLLSLPMRPTAIFAASDTQAIGVLEAAREMGLRVPENLSVVGYDNIEVADILHLTTIRQCLAESGRLGVQLLLESIANPEMNPVHRVLPTELIVRQTTAPPH
jgi:LacI family transcriptional regulator